MGETGFRSAAVNRLVVLTGLEKKALAGNRWLPADMS
jgi:hypothetical protein